MESRTFFPRKFSPHFPRFGWEYWAGGANYAAEKLVSAIIINELLYHPRP